MQAFLSDRKQRVKVHDSYSKWCLVESGIPQGSIFGPILFIIYINNLPDICESRQKYFFTLMMHRCITLLHQTKTKKICKQLLINLKNGAINGPYHEILANAVTCLYILQKIYQLLRIIYTISWHDS